MMRNAFRIFIVTGIGLCLVFIINTVLYRTSVLAKTDLTPSYSNYSSSVSNAPIITKVGKLVASDGGIVDGQMVMTYGGGTDDHIKSISVISDGGYIILGSTFSFGAGNLDIWITRMNESGSIIWQKTYGGSVYDEPSDIVEVEDGYIVVGRTNSFGVGDFDGLIMKLNLDGSIAWQKTYGHIHGDMLSSIHKTLDEGFLVVGHTQNFGAGFGSYALILKLSSDGNIVWQNTYGGNEGESLSIFVDEDETGFLLAGRTTFGAGGFDIWLLKINSDGDIAWQKTYGGIYSDDLTSVIKTTDGSYIITADTQSFGAGSHDALVIKLNSSGEIIWEKSIGWLFIDNILSVTETANGDVLVAGHRHPFSTGDNDAWLVRLNPDGNIVWQKLYGGSGFEHFRRVQETQDEGIILWGETNSFGAGDYDIWVLKTDDNGDIRNCSLYKEDIFPQMSESSVVINTSTASMYSVDGYYLNSAMISQNASATTNFICPIYSLYLPICSR